MGHEEIGAGSRIAERFALGDMIGRGGSARVFHALDELLGREVAVKVFTEDAEHADEQVRVLTREMQTLAALAHPGVVSVYDAGWTDGGAFIVMTLVTGGSLASWLSEHGALAVDDALRMGGQLCAALAHVHAHGVVHRDIKPGNVLLDAEGRPLLSDFGASADTDEQALNTSGDLIGTAGYLSPEQVRGEPVGAATDMYALGLLLLECLTGRKEYPGPALQASVARLHRRPIIPAVVPEVVASVLAALTADDPAQRPDAVEAGQALAAAAATLDAHDRTEAMRPEPVVPPPAPMPAPAPLSRPVPPEPATVVVPPAPAAAPAPNPAPAAASPVPPVPRPLVASASSAPRRRSRPRLQTAALVTAMAAVAAGAAAALTAFAATPGPAPSDATTPSTAIAEAPPAAGGPAAPLGPPSEPPSPVANTARPESSSLETRTQVRVIVPAAPPVQSPTTMTTPTRPTAPSTTTPPSTTRTTPTTPTAPTTKPSSPTTKPTTRPSTPRSETSTPPSSTATPTSGTTTGTNPGTTTGTNPGTSATGTAGATPGAPKPTG